MLPLEIEQDHDENNFRERVPMICRELGGTIRCMPPEERPIELRQILQEEVAGFLHYEPEALDPDGGHTTVLEFGGGVKAAIRHFFPAAPHEEVDANARGTADGEGRLVPASVLWNDVSCDNVFAGRFSACLTKPSSQTREREFCLHILVLSVCGNRHVRENITFGGQRPGVGEGLSAVTPWELSFIGRVFELIEQEFGHNGLEFLAHEIVRNRYFLSQSVGHDVGLERAFEAYRILFGGFLDRILVANRDRIIGLAGTM
ncbi:MAG: hypothetical protein BWZ02_00647 [Lentisphaerae bacterium ADurb.BinA184]|nr:MAG: hypothetical protein BWZ02_00647 [Lentisphaerae bacterium ADurb.BinA184]